MSNIVILGVGISGHVAAAHLRRKLPKEHEILVVSPNSNYQWIPSVPTRPIPFAPTLAPNKLGRLWTI